MHLSLPFQEAVPGKHENEAACSQLTVEAKKPLRELLPCTPLQQHHHEKQALTAKQIGDLPANQGFVKVNLAYRYDGSVHLRTAFWGPWRMEVRLVALQANFCGLNDMELHFF